MRARHFFLPENPDLFALLREQAAITVEGLDGLAAWARGDATAAEVVRSCEHRADDKKRELWRGLREAFSPPMDAEDLFSLSADLDEVLNAAKDLVREVEVLGIGPDRAMEEMTTLLASAVRHLDEAFERLERHEGDATEAADAAIRSQRNIEKVYRRAMSALLQVDDVREVMNRREVYRRLSRTGDLVHAVAERVWYAVVKEA